MNIPIQNIYYLLCYAWNKMQEKDIVTISTSDYHQLPDLLAKVLVSGCNRLIKEGLYRNYTETTEQYPGIKGKILFHETLISKGLLYGKTVCQFDEFSHDIFPNQILKGTLQLLHKNKELDRDIREEVLDCVTHFHDVADFIPRVSDFSMVFIHRNNSFYDFLLKICRFIIQQLSLDEQTGTYKFRDMLRDPKTMQSLFEKFVFNFYRIRQNEFQVHSEQIEWKAKAVKNSRMELLPQMRTDISLLSETRKIVMDTKFYSEALITNQYHQRKFHSANLYQLYAYLKNLSPLEDHISGKKISGILLYPAAGIELDEHYIIDDHPIAICTVNLAEDWRKIDERLLNLIKL
jgi:5-methylcytosine-specific restriction enzyme subunit McrC